MVIVIGADGGFEARGQEAFLTGKAFSDLASVSGRIPWVFLRGLDAQEPVPAPQWRPSGRNPWFLFFDAG